MTTPKPNKILPAEQISDILIHGEIHIVGRFVWGSNFTFLVEVRRSGEILSAVYKPSRGERPLWDFPHGTLAAREVAAYLTSKSLHWDLVPETVFRSDAPAGPGSMQFYVDADAERHYFTFSEAEKQRLRPMAVFDLLINNADRKGGHILMGRDGHIWSIDHGVCFHQEDKLRTVIWDFANETIPEEILGDLRLFLDLLAHDEDLRCEYENLLSGGEIQALIRRGRRLLRNPRFPKPASQWSYPWPLL
jgi:uncharacterized repeat protein (TIGR03843 family)